MLEALEDLCDFDDRDFSPPPMAKVERARAVIASVRGLTLCAMCGCMIEPDELPCDDSACPLIASSVAKARGQ